MIGQATRLAMAVATALLVAAAIGVDVAHAAWNDADVNGANTVSAASIGATTSAAATAPFGCATTSITWAKAAGASTYTVERSLDGGTSWSTIDADAGDVASDTDNTLPDAFTARYRVTGRVLPGAWTGAPSTSADVTCATARTLVATLADGTTTLGWQAATSATGYDIQRLVGSGSWTTLATNRAGTSYVDTAQQAAGTVVSYRVRAVGAGGVTGDWTNTATVTWSAGTQNLTVTRTIYDDYTTGYCANVTVRNDGTTPVQWRTVLSLASYPYAGTVTSSSNLTSVSTVGTDWTIEGVSWNRTLNAGASTTAQYCATRPAPPVANANVTAQVTSEWATGYCGRAVVTTTSTTPITWRITFTKSISPFTNPIYWPSNEPSMSNATTISRNPTRWVIGGAGWNDTIVAGQTREFTWCANKS